MCVRLVTLEEEIMKNLIDAVNEFKGDTSIFSFEECNDIDVPVVLTCIKDCDCGSGLVSVGDMIVGTSGFTETYFTQVCNESEFIQCVDEMSKAEWIKPVTLPTFTQEMADTGTLPPINSEYLDEDGQLCTSLLHHGSFVLGEMQEHCPINQYPVFSTSRNDRVSVLTPPIVLDNGKAYQLTYRNIETCAIYSKDHNLLYSAESIIDIKDCANIQLLEVTS